MTPAPSPAIDPHSFAQGPALPHLTLALAVNFASQTLAGSATWQLATPLAEPTEVVFDTRDLVIERVWTNAEGTGPEAAHTLGTPDATLGQALRIALPAGTAAVRIAYRTRPPSDGWPRRRRPANTRFYSRSRRPFWRAPGCPAPTHRAVASPTRPRWKYWGKRKGNCWP